MAIEPMILVAIILAARVMDVPAPLICAIIDQESGWNIHAMGDHDEEGHPHSFGLMQLHDKGAGYGYSPDQLLDPYFNIFVGSDYLRYCLKIHPNNLKLAISGYNQGCEGAAERGYSYNKTYVENVLALIKKYEEELKPQHGK